MSTDTQAQREMVARLTKAANNFPAHITREGQGLVTVQQSDLLAIIAALAARPGVEEGWQVVPVGEPCSLQDCPPGPFLFNGALGFKTEYGASVGKDAGGGKVDWTVTHWADPYCLESGEVFWGGAKGHEARSALIVQPLAAAPRPGEGA